MIITRRTNSQDTIFQALVKELDAELKIRDGEEHSFYAQFNRTDHIRFVVVAYEEDEPAGCGSVKEYSSNTMEVKRMFVQSHRRGKGIASIILMELEQWCMELGFEKCILETGLKQPDAIRLYRKNNYCQIPNYGQYENAANSICFEKYINSENQ